MASIWEQMVLEEQKKKAQSLGIRICDLEELEVMQVAMQENVFINSTSNQTSEIDVECKQIVTADKNPTSGFKTNDKIKKSTNPEFTSNSKSNQTVTSPLQSKTIQHAPTIVPIQQILNTECGPWIHLTQVLVDKILCFVGDPDMCGYLHMTSKTVFQPTDTVYHFLCELIYLRQTAKKQLVLNVNWKTYKLMIINRPRLRLNGFYSLRTLYSRAPCNDNFWEPKKYASVETVFYRHFRFFDFGRVLYTIDIVDPFAIEKVMLAGQAVPKKVFDGKYTLTGRNLVIEILLPHCKVYFELVLMNGDDGYCGNHNMLQLMSHSTSLLPTNNPQLAGQHELKTQLSLPNRTDFRFHRFYNTVNLTSW